MRWAGVWFRMTRLLSSVLTLLLSHFELTEEGSGLSLAIESEEEEIEHHGRRYDIPEPDALSRGRVRRRQRQVLAEPRRRLYLHRTDGRIVGQD